MIAGAILILAAAVLLAGGLLADAVCVAYGQSAYLERAAYFVSLVVGMLGLFFLFADSIIGTFRPTLPSPGNAPRQNGGPTI